jgi:xanthosine utilization system XapX-like protein
MKANLLSLGAGVLVYRPPGVRSPAPPVIGKQLPSGTALSAAWRQSDRSQQLFGSRPGLQATATTAAVKIPETRS